MRLTLPIRLFWGQYLQDVDAAAAMGSLKNDIPRHTDFFADTTKGEN